MEFPGPVRSNSIIQLEGLGRLCMLYWVQLHRGRANSTRRGGLTWANVPQLESLLQVLSGDEADRPKRLSR